MLTENPINPIVFKVTKVEDTFPPGIIKIILKQDHFNKMTDNVDLMIADYYSSAIEPEEPLPETPSVNITYNGSSPKLVLGGSYKTFTATLNEGSPLELNGTWFVTLPVGNEDKFDIEYPQSDTMRICVEKDFSLVGEVIQVQYVIPNQAASNIVELEVTAR